MVNIEVIFYIIHLSIFFVCLKIAHSTVRISNKNSHGCQFPIARFQTFLFR
jgi:hypothetical protein